MRRAALIPAALVAAALCVPALAVAAGAPKSFTFHLVEKQIAFNFVDNPPRQGFNAAPLIGDQFAFTSDLQTRSGAHAGSLEATCMVARGGSRASGPCYGVFGLAGGQLMGNVTEVAIVGGTGAYRGATGYVTSVSRGQNSDYTDDTFHIQLP
jgi:hypothetical protein